ncbi:ABC transporter substrate-binding protein [Oscillospiraceae bacterium HV4-5-C5C]|nr:ABC transporter substrate-binding protein [Oscillospiraceae bacterium HV4-5-C5C]
MKQLKRTAAFLAALSLMAAGLSACTANTGNSTSSTSSAARTAGATETGSGTSQETALQSSQTASSDSQETTLTGTGSADTAATDDTADLTVTIGALKGPTAMGMVQIMSQAEAGPVDGTDYQFSLSASPDEITPLLAKGELDLAAVPANLAAVLYNNTEGQIQVLDINTLGVLYIVENGDSVQSLADLKGKTLYASGKGATPEYALNYLLEKNGLDPETDLTIEWKSEHAECVAALAQDPNGIALLPEPFVTTAKTQNPELRTALDLSDIWDQVQADDGGSSQLITGVLVGRKAFIEEQPEAVAAFMTRYKASVEFVNSDTAAAAELIDHFGIVSQAVAQAALPACKITFIDGEDMKTALSGYLQVLADQNPQAIGGQLPADDFYYLGQ